MAQDPTAAPSTWALERAKLDANFQKVINPGGWGFYSDSAVAVEDAQSVANHATDFTILTNDAAAFAVEELPFDTVNPLWNVAGSKIEPYNLHDTFHIRLRMVVENYSGSSPFVELVIDANGGSGIIEARSTALLKGGVAQIVELTGPMFVGADFLEFGGVVKMRYDGNGSIDVYQKSAFIERVYCKDNG